MKKQLTITYTQDLSEDGTALEIYNKQSDLSVTITDPEAITEWGHLVVEVKALPISSWRTEGGKLLDGFFDRHFYGGTK